MTTVLLRVLLVPLGYAAGLVAGLIVLAAGAWRWGGELLTRGNEEAVVSVVGALMAAPFALAVGAFAVTVAALVGILLAEAFTLRSWLYHALVGAVAALVGRWFLLAPQATAGPGPVRPELVVAAGLAGGLVYWLIAGRTSGRRPNDPAPPP